MSWEVRVGDCLDVLATLEPGTVQTCITSPAYFGLRDYGHPGQLGLEPTPEEYVARLVEVFRGVRRVLRDDGTLWLNLGDSYAATGKSGGGEQGERWNEYGADTTGPRGGKWSPAPPGLKPKDLVGVPWRVAFALQADGWTLRSDIVWSKPNPMPESVTDRPTKAHEYLFLLSKAPRYYYDADAIRQDFADSRNGNPGSSGVRTYASNDRNDSGRPMAWDRGLEQGGRNRRSVWTIPTQPFPGAHFAVMPPALVEPCILAGSKPGDLVLDPFAGAATVGVVCRKHQRRFLGIELNEDYARMARGRLGEDVTHELPEGDAPLFQREVAP